MASRHILKRRKKTRISLRDLLDNRIQDLAYPRPDFQGAAWQMLIGILQCTIAPEDKEEWADIWHDGIEFEQWEKALNTISLALQFGEQKPSFLQSFDPLDSEYGSIAGLLVDAPGGNTLKLNKDHFVKRGNVEQICPHCAAIALFAIQTNSPAGGAGYRVGMRGGGPLTTLVVPQEEDKYPLWKNFGLTFCRRKSRRMLHSIHSFFLGLRRRKPAKKREMWSRRITRTHCKPTGGCRDA